MPRGGPGAGTRGPRAWTEPGPAPQHWPVFTEMKDLLTLVPPLVGLKGNLEMTLASRLSTAVSDPACPRGQALNTQWGRGWSWRSLGGHAHVWGRGGGGKLGGADTQSRSWGLTCGP